MRTYPVVSDHIDPIVTYLDSQVPFPVGEWERPKDLSARFQAPPYALVRPFPSAGEFGGPLSDSQVDITMRVQILSVGETQAQAIRVADICRPHMQRENIAITNRSVMDLRMMVVAGGVARDDDLPEPFFYASDLYELQTTPA